MINKKTMREYHRLGMAIATEGEIHLNGTMVTIDINRAFTAVYDLITGDLVITEGQVAQIQEELVSRLETGLEKMQDTILL